MEITNFLRLLPVLVIVWEHSIPGIQQSANQQISLVKSIFYKPFSCCPFLPRDKLRLWHHLYVRTCTSAWFYSFTSHMPNFQWSQSCRILSWEWKAARTESEHNVCIVSVVSECLLIAASSGESWRAGLEHQRAEELSEGHRLGPGGPQWDHQYPLISLSHPHSSNPHMTVSIFKTNWSFVSRSHTLLFIFPLIQEEIC